MTTNAPNFPELPWHSHMDAAQNELGLERWNTEMERLCTGLNVLPHEILEIIFSYEFQDLLCSGAVFQKSVDVKKRIEELMVASAVTVNDQPNELHVHYGGEGFVLGCTYAWNSDSMFVEAARAWAKTKQAKAMAMQALTTDDDGESIEISPVTLLTAEVEPSIGVAGLLTAIRSGSFAYVSERLAVGKWEILGYLVAIACSQRVEILKRREQTLRDEELKLEKTAAIQAIINPKGNRQVQVRRELLNNGYMPTPKYLLIGQIGAAIEKGEKRIKVVDHNNRPIPYETSLTKLSKFSYEVEVISKAGSSLNIGRAGLTAETLKAEGIGIDPRTGQTFLDLIGKPERQKSLLSMITEDVSSLTKSAYTIDFFVAILKNIMVAINENPNQSTAGKDVYTISWEQIAETMGLNRRESKLQRTQIFKIRCELRHMLRAIMSHPISFRLNYGKGKKPMVYDGPLLNIQALSEVGKNGFGNGEAFACAKFSLTDVLGSQLFGSQDGESPPSFSLMDSKALFDAGNIPTNGRSSIRRTRYQQMQLYIDAHTYDAIRTAENGKSPTIVIKHDDVESETSICFSSDGNLDSKRKARVRAIAAVEDIFDRMVESKHIDGYDPEPENNLWKVYVGVKMVSANFHLIQAQGSPKLDPPQDKKVKTITTKRVE